MKAITTSKAITILLLLASLALNVAFLSGCVTRGTFVGDNPSPPDDGRARLVPIAKILEIPTEGKSAFALESAIRTVLDQSMIVPRAFDKTAFEKMAKDLTTQEEEAMREYQRFILRLQGKRIIAIGGAD